MLFNCIVHAAGQRTLMGVSVPYSLYVSMPTSMKVVCDEKIRSPHPCVDCAYEQTNSQQYTPVCRLHSCDDAGLDAAAAWQFTACRHTTHRSSPAVSDSGCRSGPTSAPAWP